MRRIRWWQVHYLFFLNSQFKNGVSARKKYQINKKIFFQITNILNQIIKFISFLLKNIFLKKISIWYFFPALIPNALFKKYAFKRILMCAASIRKKQGFDHYECEILCNQIIKYKDELDPFDLNIALAKDNSLNWWRWTWTTSSC